MADPSRILFSKTRLQKLPIPTKSRCYYYDSKVPGLAICITSAGGRAYYVYRWHDGKPVRVRLAAFDDISVEDVRKLAQKTLGDFASGINPQAQKRKEREALTFGRLFSHWIELVAKPHKRSWKADQNRYDLFLKPWEGRRLAAISRADVAALHAKIGRENGHYQANRVLALVCAMFNRAEEIGWNGPNPAARVRRFPEPSRDRFLGTNEVAKFFEALKSRPEVFRDAFTVALLTAARWGNVAGMRWEDIDFDRLEWRIPETKSGKPVFVRLAPAVIEILERRRQTALGSPWVFPNRRDSLKPIGSPRDHWTAVCRDAGLANVRVHDLRRTFGSWQASLGANLATISKALGHRPGSSATWVYARLTDESLKQSVETTAAAILAAAAKKDEKAEQQAEEQDSEKTEETADGTA